MAGEENIVNNSGIAKALEGATQRKRNLEDSGVLTEEMKSKRLSGIRVFVIKDLETNQFIPFNILYGKDFPNYRDFTTAVHRVEDDFLQKHPIGDRWTLEDRWAQDVDDFIRNYPDLLPQFPPTEEYLPDLVEFDPNLAEKLKVAIISVKTQDKK